MIEITLPMVAWVAVVVFQAVLHFGILPRQRREIEEEAKAEAEIMERLKEYNNANDLCTPYSLRATDGMSAGDADECCSKSALGIDHDEHDAADGDASVSSHPGKETYGTDTCYLMRSRGIGGEANSTLSEANPADDNSCSSVEDEEEDLDCIDDGLEQSRLKLLRYYYSPSSPDIFKMEPFRSSCGSISSLDESEDPERKARQRATTSQPSISNGVLRRRNVQNESIKDTGAVAKHVMFADKQSSAFAVHSSPVVQCA